MKSHIYIPSGHEQKNSPRPSTHKPPCWHGELEHSSIFIWQRSPEKADEHKHDSRLSSGLIIHVPLFKHLFWQRFDIWKQLIKAKNIKIIG
jgi:hypothetical protein